MLVTAVVDGKDQVFSVKDGDRPFRTTAFATAYKAIYSFDFFGGDWFVKLPPGSPFPPPSPVRSDHAGLPLRGCRLAARVHDRRAGSSGAANLTARANARHHAPALLLYGDALLRKAS
jgi:hypothetical protein